jgi:nickel-dependent lactate racemase
MEELENETEIEETVSNDQVEYWKAEAERAREQAEKYKNRFKTEKAKQSQVVQPTEATEADVDSAIEKKL